MTTADLLNEIDKIVAFSQASKFDRLLQKPYKYLYAIIFRELIYKFRRKSKEANVGTFFGSNMIVSLPSSTDIFLTGGKSHSSEIRLAKFLIRNLHMSSIFLDIGAHYGFFSLLASKLVGDTGRVVSFEASPTTFEILDRNKNFVNNIDVYNKAISDSGEILMFYEFPNLYSEYNTLMVKQFEDESWYKEFQPKKIQIESITLDSFLSKNNIAPDIIKIDVEGAEFAVISGMTAHLSKNAPIITMEYLSSKRNNHEHIRAEKMLNKMGYNANLIDQEGEIKSVDNISLYLDQNELESDNIVFIKN